jgi:hypothetical protein
MAGMKIQRPLQLLFASVVLMWITGCATYPRSGQAALVGTWTNSLGTVWTMKADNTFDVVNAKRHIWGNVTVAGDTVTIQETGGNTPKGCKGPAEYRFNRSAENTLTFTLVKDGCKERIKNVTLRWHRK